MAAGGDVAMNHDGVKKISVSLRDFCAPGAVDSVRREVARFSQFKRTGRTMDEYMAQFDVLPRKEGSEMQMGGASPEISA